MWVVFFFTSSFFFLSFLLFSFCLFFLFLFSFLFSFFLCLFLSVFLFLFFWVLYIYVCVCVWSLWHRNDLFPIFVEKPKLNYMPNHVSSNFHNKYPASKLRYHTPTNNNILIINPTKASKISLILQVCIYLFSVPQAEVDTMSVIFKQNTVGLNSECSFF